MSRVAARAGQLALFQAGWIKFQQFGKRRCSRLVHGRTHGHLYRFQIQTTRLAVFGENQLQEMFALVIEPGWKSPSCESSSRRWLRSSSRLGNESVMGAPWVV